MYRKQSLVLVQHRCDVTSLQTSSFPLMRVLKTNIKTDREQSQIYEHDCRIQDADKFDLVSEGPHQPLQRTISINYTNYRLSLILLVYSIMKIRKFSEENEATRCYFLFSSRDPLGGKFEKRWFRRLRLQAPEKLFNMISPYERKLNGSRNVSFSEE